MGILTADPQRLIKLVYYGPAIVGKRTNLVFLYQSLSPQVKGKQMCQAMNDRDQLVFFDCVIPDLGTIQGEVPVFRLQCLGGAVSSLKSRQDVLSDARGVVFVADSVASHLDANKQVFAVFAQHLQNQGTSLATFPWVLQYTKRDVHQILSVAELQREFNRYNVPYFEANPVNGQNVIETLKALLLLVMKSLKSAQERDAG